VLDSRRLYLCQMWTIFHGCTSSSDPSYI
jgi:hypothetical protein